MPCYGKIIVLDIGQCKIYNKYSDNQQALTSISNQVLNNFTPKIQKDCKYIFKYLTALEPLTKILSVETLLI